jgi:hypothetical protein
VAEQPLSVEADSAISEQSALSEPTDRPVLI